MSSSGAWVGADVLARAQATDADLAEAFGSGRAVGVGIARRHVVAGKRADLGADFLAAVRGIDPAATEAIRREAELADGVARQTTGAIGAKRAAGALTVGALPTEVIVVAHVLARDDIRAANLVGRAGGATLIVRNADTLALLLPGLAVGHAGVAVTNLTAWAGGDALAGIAGGARRTTGRLPWNLSTSRLNCQEGGPAGPDGEEDDTDRSTPKANARTGTAERMLDHAEQLVQTRGFNGFSYADIARELGVTKASLHYHFPTKAALGVRLIERYGDAFAAALAAIDASTTSAPAKLRGYVDIYSRVLRNDRMCLCGMLAADFATLPEPMKSAVTRFFLENEAWLADVLAWGREAGELRFAGEPLEVARLLVGSLEGAMLVARSFGELDRFQAIADRLLLELASGEPVVAMPSPA